MGCSSGMWTGVGVYNAKQNLSAIAAVLPFIEQTQVYNALNFNWGAEDDTTVLCYKINQTGTNAQINGLICPSDPNAGKPDNNNTTNTTNYYACVGTTMTWGLLGNQAPWGNLAVTAINMPSTGMFTWQASYGINSCTDGTSNTIAFSEAAVGTQNERPRQRLLGLQGVGISMADMVYDASANPAAVNRIVALCSAAWNSTGTGFID